MKYGSIVCPLIHKGWIMEPYDYFKTAVPKIKVQDVRIQVLIFSDSENGCMQGSFMKRMHARVFLSTDAHNQKGHFEGCTQRIFGKRSARHGANPGCAQSTSTPHTVKSLSLSCRCCRNHCSESAGLQPFTE